MIGKTNSGIILAILNISAAKSCTVTLTQSGRAFSFSGTGTYMSFKLPTAGTWTITTQFNGYTEVKTVTLSPGEVRNVTVLDALYLYNRGAYLSGFGTGWSRGEEANRIIVWRNTYQSGGTDATSNGTANLNNIRTIRIEFEVGIYAEPDTNFGSEGRIRLKDASGNVLTAKQWAFGHASHNAAHTWDVDVSDISAAKFSIWVNGGQGSAQMIIYSIRLIPG